MIKRPVQAVPGDFAGWSRIVDADMLPIVPLIPDDHAAEIIAALNAPARDAARDAEIAAEARRDATRYQRLRILGCAPHGHPGLDKGTVLRASGLDDFLDKDIQRHPSRGEFRP